MLHIKNDFYSEFEIIHPYIPVYTEVDAQKFTPNTLPCDTLPSNTLPYDSLLPNTLPLKFYSRHFTPYIIHTLP